MDRAELIGRLATAPDRLAAAARQATSSEAASRRAPWSALEERAYPPRTRWISALIAGSTCARSPITA